ncbi:type IV secretion system DNA-binding domain-containig protein (plasmid) [Klebsiella pneumoniae]|nr:type IV secretory system conjugative DNA transfer family protein [Klebsiella pneumoniae]UNC85213.1 type IV secretion system DNA-binding domain-containig protein [Klebsiella pneumoniae]
METFNYLINIVFSSLVTIYFFLVPFGGFLSVFLGLIYLTANLEKRQKLQSLGLLSLVIGLINPLGYFWIPLLRSYVYSVDYELLFPLGFLALTLGSAFLGFAAWLGWTRYCVPFINKYLHQFTRRTELERNRKTDVREIEKFLPTAKLDYNPDKWLSVDPKKTGLFAGINELGKPIFIPYEKWRSAHVQIVGTSGFGKGVATGILLSQAMRAGETVIVFDPKNDEWAPHVLRQSAEQAEVPFYLVDLESDFGQLDLLAGATAFEIEELLSAGFSLGDSGDIADHYRLKDRAAIRNISQLVNAGARTVADLAYSELANSYEKECEGAIFKLRELALCRAISGVGGIDMKTVVKNGGCLYIIGSMDNSRLMMAQKMLLVRLQQIVKKRDRITETPRPVCAFLDEVKYLLSRKSLEGLGAARDKGLHFVLTHQSLGDLKDCPRDLNPEAVVGAIVENCSIRIAYRVQNPDTALWLAKMTGEIQVDDETRRVERNAGGAELLSHERTIRQSTRNLIDTNMLLNLPGRTAVVFGSGQPQFAHICPILAEKKPLTVYVAPEPVVPVVEPLIPAPAVTTVPVEKNSKPKPQPKKTVPIETRNYEDDDMHDYLQEYNNADF